MPTLIDIATLLFCYVCGAIPTGLLVARAARGIDIREHGSRNIGATNVWRVLGWRLGLATFLIDVFKAWLAVTLVPVISTDTLPAMAVLGGVAVLLGNFFNVFLGFKGGKGVAASLGVFLALAPLAVLLTFLAFVIIVAVTRYISLGSIIGAVLLPVLVYAFQGTGPLLYMLVGISLLVIFKHRANIRRLMAGTESKFSFKKRAA